MLKKISVLFVFLFLSAGMAVYSQSDYSHEVNIKITVIKASNERGGIDPQLSHLSSQLVRLNYSSYQFLMQDAKTGVPKDELFFTLPDGDVLRVVLLTVDEPYIKLYVAMKKAGLNTNFKIANHGTVIVGGNRFKGGSLVIAITATY